MSFAFTAVGKNGVERNFDPGDEATMNCLKKEGVMDCDSYSECKIKISKGSFPDSIETLADGGTYYFTGLSAD